MSEEEETPQGDADDVSAFEELIKNQPAEDGPVELASLWEGFEYIWKRFNNGSVLIRGIVFAEYIDDEGKHSFKWQVSPEMPPWAAMGMLQQALIDLQGDAMAQSFVDIIVNNEDDDEDDEIDEQ